jgi:predicted dehydrogenase
MSQRVIGVGVIGCGSVAVRNHIPNLKQVSSARIVAVVDVDEASAKKGAEAAGITAWYKDYRELLKREDVEYIVLTTPPFVRKEVVVEAAEAGKHLYVEKPLALNLEDADAMIAAAEKAGVKLATGFQLRFQPTYVKVKELIEDGTIGQPVNMWCVNTMKVARDSWMYNQSKSAGCIVTSQCHYIDQFRWWSGDAERVFGRAKSILEGTTDPAIDNVSMTIQFKNGAFASLTGSYSSYQAWEDWGVIGKNGAAEKSLNVLRVRGENLLGQEIMYTEEGPTHQIYMGQYRAWGLMAYRLAHTNFIRCIREERALSPPIATGEDGRAALEIALAAYESQRTGKELNLPLH